MLNGPRSNLTFFQNPNSLKYSITNANCVGGRKERKIKLFWLKIHLSPKMNFVFKKQSVVTWLFFSVLFLCFRSLGGKAFENWYTIKNGTMEIKLHQFSEEIKEKCNVFNVGLPNLTTSCVSNRNEWISVILSFEVMMTRKVNINNLLLRKPHSKKKISLRQYYFGCYSNKQEKLRHFCSYFFFLVKSAKSH